jgi:hypothetical protein
VLLPATGPNLQSRLLPISVLVDVRSEAEFAVGAHHHLFGRIPDDAEVQEVVKLLATGRNREHVLYEMYAAPERARHLTRTDWTFVERHAYAAFELLADLQIPADPRVVTVLATGIFRRGDPDVFRSVKTLFDRKAIPSGRVRLKTVASVGRRSPKSILRGMFGLLEGNARWGDIRVKLARRSVPTVDLNPLTRELGFLRQENARLEQRIIEISARVRHLDDVVSNNHLN